MMQGVKISWVGRSFALAGASDSSRRHKVGKRKTKDERRIMIELFVEKYKASNKGEFPTVTLTHKEVGGTFYTVREIWQEVKQKDKSDETLVTDLKCEETKNQTSRHAVQPLSLPEESYMPISSASAEDNNRSLDLKHGRYQEPVSEQEKNVIDQTRAMQEFNILETPLVTNAASNVIGVQPLQELTNGKFISCASNGVFNSSHSLELKEDKYQENLSDAEKQENTFHTEVTKASCPNEKTQTKREINTVEREVGKSAKSVVNGLPSLQKITNRKSIGLIDNNHGFQYQEGLSDTSKKKNDIHYNLTKTFGQNDQTKEQEDIKNVERPQGTSATSVVMDLQPLQKLQSITISNGGLTDKKQRMELKDANYQESLSDTEDPKVIIHKDFMETGCPNNQTQAYEETKIVETTLGTGAGSILTGLQPHQEVTCGTCLEKDVQNELKNFMLHENQKNESMHEPATLFQISETEAVTDRNVMEPYNSSMKNVNKPDTAEVKEQELNLSNEISSSSFIPLGDDGYVGEFQSSNKLDTLSLEKQNSSGSGEELQHALHMPSENGSMFSDQKVTTLGAFADSSSHVASYDGYKKHLALDSSKASSSTSDSHSTLSVMESPMNLSYSANHEHENVLLINSTKEMIEESTTSYDIVSSSKTDFSTTQEKATGMPDKDLEGQILFTPYISADQTLSGVKVDAADAFPKRPDEFKNVEKSSSSKYCLELPGNSETLSLEASPHQQGESETIENTRRSTENYSDENSVSILENSDGTYSNSASLKDLKKAETNIIAGIFMKILDAVLDLLKK